MSHLSLVKSLSHLKEAQKHTEEISLDSVGLALTRGALAEMIGAASSGKTALSLSLLAELTSRGEICAVVDSSNSFDPCSATLAGVVLENLLWIKCGGELEKAFMAADYLVQAKGFGAVWLNLSGLSKGQLRMVPRTYWYRFRTRIKETPTLFLITSEFPVAGSASQQSFLFKRRRAEWLGTGRFKLLKEFYLSIHPRKQFYEEPFLTRIELDYRDV